MKPLALILMYHDLVAPSQRVAIDRMPYALDPDVFTRHLEILASQRRRIVPVGTWVMEAEGEHKRTVEAAGRPPDILLTFDDGDRSNFTTALPLLQRHGLSATFFLTVGCVGQEGYLTWEQVRALREAGMEIGSHTLTHRPPALLTDDELRYELVESKHRLEDRLGMTILSVSSPTGFYNAKIGALARESGYRAVCIGRIGAVTSRTGPFALPRLPVKRTINDADFRRLIAPSRIHLMRLRTRQIGRDVMKRLLGPATYLRLRRMLLQRRNIR